MTKGIGDEIYALIEKLYPINRSITGNGLRESLRLVQKELPIELHEIPTGTKVLDWNIPKEWNIKKAWIKDSKGEKIIDFAECNLHVVNYSIPISRKMGLDELKKHIHTLEDQPDLIPYRTSYHNEYWGFCMAHNDLMALEDDEYEVLIDSELKNGSLTYGEILIKGESEKEVLISSHFCHPSLANDNLSGVAVAAYLARMLSEMSTYHSYRFLFIPGTIGSISWLSKNESNLDRIEHGLVLTLLGDSNHFNYKTSRQEDAPIDKIVKFCLKTSEEVHGVLDFSPYGYDERQYCSPGFDLPVGRLSRSLHGEFPEYHTSADNLSFIDKIKLEESYDFLTKIIHVIENNFTYLNLHPKGEPQLGRRGLFKKIGGHRSAQDMQMALLWILNQSDGTNSVLDIAEKSNLDFDLLVEASADLEKVGLIQKIL
jgi:aminopeptidase-like protein